VKTADNAAENAVENAVKQDSMSGGRLINGTSLMSGGGGGETMRSTSALSSHIKHLPTFDSTKFAPWQMMQVKGEGRIPGDGVGWAGGVGWGRGGRGVQVRFV
jgi:hypothetical protein